MNDRCICEICGRSSPTDSDSCAHCGTAFTEDAIPIQPQNPNVPYGREQTRLLLADTRTFLTEGRLGELRPGCTRADVMRIAGIPADFGRGESLDDAEIWINGALTFWFEGSRLERIGIYFILEYPHNQAIDFDDSFPRRGDDVDMIVKFMTRHGIDYEQRDGSLLTEGNVEIRWSTRDAMITSLIVPPVPMPRRT